MPSGHVRTLFISQLARRYPVEYQAPALLDDELKALNAQVLYGPDGGLA